jgi:hypothetical protein
LTLRVNQSLANTSTSVNYRSARPPRLIQIVAPFSSRLSRNTLAQLVKRLGYDDAQRLSSRYDGGEERDAMLSSIDKLRRALAEAGFAPR